MDDEVLGLGPGRRSYGPRKSGRRQGLRLPAPHQDDLLSRLQQLYAAYAAEDEVPDRLAALARKIGEAYETFDSPDINNGKLVAATGRRQGA